MRQLEAQREEVACLGSQGPLFTSYSSQRFLLASVSLTSYPHSPPRTWRIVLITNGHGALLRRNCPLPGWRALVLWSHPSLYLPVPHPKLQIPLPPHQGAVGGSPGQLRRVSLRPLEQLSHLLPACCLRSLNLAGHSRHNNYEQSEQEENPNEKSGKVKTGARCLSRGTLIVFL